METPRVKRQRLGSGEASSPLIRSPINDNRATEPRNREPAMAIDSDVDSDIDSDIGTAESQKSTTEREVSAADGGGETDGAMEREDEDGVAAAAAAAADEPAAAGASGAEDETGHSATSFSPLKLGGGPATRVGPTEGEEDGQGTPAQPSYKQLMARFNTLVEDIVADGERRTGPGEAGGDGSMEESSESARAMELATLQNRYEALVTDLNIQLEDKRTAVNGLTNEVGNYRQKVSNMHLAIEQAQSDNSTLAAKNEALSIETRALRDSVASLNRQLALEKNRHVESLAKMHGLKEAVAPLFSSYESMYAQLDQLRGENSALQSTINEQQAKIGSFEDTLKQELESLAQELYIQYAEKHESKISKLRTAYETKYSKKHALFNEKLQLLQNQHKTLQQELAHVKNRLQVESNEKHQLIKLWDEYVALDKKDVDEMSNFVKRLK